MKIQIVLPDPLAKEFKETIPARQRSRFIADAVQNRLKALKFKDLLKESVPAWGDKRHPDLKTQADVNRYLSAFRTRLG